MPDAAPGRELAAEQRHLQSARAGLARMRERTSALEAMAGDPVSTEYLKAALWRRVRALEDDPDTPLFFGRLDYGRQSAAGEESFHIGRRHVSDEHGDPLVVDWRADISRPFYRASRSEPYGVVLRRRFGFSRGVLTAYEDEHLLGGEETAASAILEAEIERPRVGPMRDIVATIQPEQDDIVRGDLRQTVCVQGAPGTGKTAVGLHRAAYLLYAHRDQLQRQGVLVIGPNASFLRYIGDVLPALGEIDARQTTLEELVGRVSITATEPAALGRLKGDARLAEVVNRAVWSQLDLPSEALVLPRGSRRWRVPAYEAAALINALRLRGVRYGAGRQMLAQQLAHAILVKMELAGDSPDDRVQDAVARARPVKAYVDAAWPAVDPARLVARLLSDPGLLSRCSDGILDPGEQALLLSGAVTGAGRRRAWSLADAVLVDEASDLVQRMPSLGHVVLDEAQDLSPMQLRAVGRRCSTGSATVLGDLAQATTVWATGSWAEALAHLGKPDAHVEELTRGFRVPAEVISFAARLLPITAPQLRPPSSIRRSPGDLVVARCDDPVAAAVSRTVEALRRAGSIGVIAPDRLAPAVSAALAHAAVAFGQLGADDGAEARVMVVPATLAKGLEFDHVVLVEPAQIVAQEPEPVTGLRRLYVCLTRAVTTLAVVHREPLPAPLTRPPVPTPLTAAPLREG
jgi:DNA helicase IV